MSMHSAGLFLAWRRRGSDRNLKWKLAKNGDVPAGAVEVGRLGGRGGEFMYIGRVALSTQDVLPGTVIPSRNACFIAWDGRELEVSHYEVLANTEPDLCHIHWSSLTAEGTVPPDAVKAGYDAAREDVIYVARARPPGQLGTHAGILHNGDSHCTLAYNGVEYYVGDFKVLCRKLLTHSARPFTRFGARLLRKNTQHLLEILKWVDAENGNVPIGSVEAGLDGDDCFYVGRITIEHTGEVVPGTIVPSKGACLAPFDGVEIASSKYEVLVNTNPISCITQWTQPSIDFVMPNNAVKGGIYKGSSGEVPLYIARAFPPGDHHYHYVCKLRDGDIQAVMSFDGASYTVEDFRILCVDHPEK